MRSTQTTQTFPLSSVKPLEDLLHYRAFCLEATRRALARGATHRVKSPVGDFPLEPVGTVQGLPYVRCPATGSLFLTDLPSPDVWTEVLREVNRYRHSPHAFHRGALRERMANVYTPKLEWIETTLRLHGLSRPRLLEVAIPPSDLTNLLRESPALGEVVTVEEMAFVSPRPEMPAPLHVQERFQAALLLESLDRVSDPSALLSAVRHQLMAGGLVFITALVWSGFEFAVLGFNNQYLYPPDRTNCFTLQGLEQLLERHGLSLVESSTPGVLDLEIVLAHVQYDSTVPLSIFERQLLSRDDSARDAFQTFLQQYQLSSFARIVGRKAHAE